MTEKEQGPGRPDAGRRPSATPKKAMGGKGRALSANISQELREALEAEADRTGRSISQVAERWLDDARKGRAEYRAMLGGTQLAATVEKLVAIAGELKPRVAADLWDMALVAAWTAVLPAIAPAVPAGDDELSFQMQSERVGDACQKALAAIDAAPDDDPVRLRLDTPVDLPKGRASIRARLAEASNGGGDWELTHELIALQRAGETGAAEVLAAIGEQLSLNLLTEARLERHDDARRIGRAVAAAHMARGRTGAPE